MESAEGVAVVGLGQIGSELASGFRGGGIEVTEVHRDLEGLASLESCRAVVLAVPEDVLAEVAARLPATLRSRAVLVQNELVPSTWRSAGLASPTIAVVWFEKKGDRPPRPILTTPVGGPHAQLVVDALVRRSLPAEVVEPGAQLVHALVAKNLYIVVSNLAGLAASRSGRAGEAGAAGAAGDVEWPTGATTMGDLLAGHRSFTRALAAEVFAIERARVDAGDRPSLEFAQAWSVLEAATRADPAHVCLGRSAPARLARAKARAAELGVGAPIVEALARAALAEA